MRTNNSAEARLELILGRTRAREKGLDASWRERYNLRATSRRTLPCGFSGRFCRAFSAGFSRHRLERPSERAVWNAELARRGAKSLSFRHQCARAVDVDVPSRPAEVDAATACGSNASAYAVANRAPFPLGHQDRHLRHQLASRGRGVDPIFDADEGAAGRDQFVDEQAAAAGASERSIAAEDHHRVEPAPPGPVEHLVNDLAVLRGAANALLDEAFNDRPAASAHVTFDHESLGVESLIVGGDAEPHRNLAAADGREARGHSVEDTETGATTNSGKRRETRSFLAPTRIHPPSGRIEGMELHEVVIYMLCANGPFRARMGGLQKRSLARFRA